MKEYIPNWHKELGIFSRIKPMLILEGNVLDSYQYPVDGNAPKGSILRLPEYLHYYYKDLGYDNIIFYDSLRGFYNNIELSYFEKFSKLLGVENNSDNCIKADFRFSRHGKVENNASNYVYRALTQKKEATVVIMNNVSRYISSPDNLEQDEVDAFTMLMQTTLEAEDVRKEKNAILKNIIIFITNKSNDIPAWFYLHNPNVKILSLSFPSKEERELFVKSENFPAFFDSVIYKEDSQYFYEHKDELERIQNKFIALTEGLSFTEINGLRRLCKNEKIHIKDFCNVIDLYKYGIKDNPWKKINIEKIKNAEVRFEERVKGQKTAVIKTLDILKRAITGMSGLQGSSQTRPKGVLFFAGPTGTGKTETAKTLSELIFEDESSCIRFDMSEYGQSHSDQKLLGAPPGYVGYEAGGQLTNAVKNNPFSILLFDEIEKAHPSILDKFLQILEDGRMTDGKGNTVYFSETIIIFTSNLGIYNIDNNGAREENVNPEMNYNELQVKVKKSIEDYFKIQLGRPEILNRIGENIVVFDYIRPDIAKIILETQIGNIIKTLMDEKSIRITISNNEVISFLYNESISNLSNGGRGIGNIVEKYFINPLSRYIFDNDIKENSSITINQIEIDDISPRLICTVQE